VALVPSTREGGANGVLSWDFSETHLVSQVPWPLEKANHKLYQVEPHARVIVRVTKSKTIDRIVDMLTFSKETDGQLVWIGLDLPNQTLADIGATAISLCEQFELPQERVEKWLELTRSGKEASVIAARNDRYPQVSLEIFPSYEKEKPYWISLQIGWLKLPTTRK
jgi:hypothetical protein